MIGRGDTSERRAFAVVMAVVLLTVLCMLLLRPGDDAHAALVAQTRDGRPARDDARLETADGPQPIVKQEAFVLPDRREVEQAALALPALVDDRIAGWVDDLRDDGIRFNATKAMRRLAELPAGEIPELNAALTAFDVQLRHFAAGVLRARVAHGKAAASDALLRVSVDALRSGLGTVARDAYATYVGSLTVNSARFLRRHAVAARDILVAALTSPNAQQRFLSAYLLAQAGVTERPGYERHEGRIAFELLGHLADNNISGDALMATHGLYRLGPNALPILLDNRRFMDPQAQKLIDLIRLDLQQPPRNKKELQMRGRKHRISSIYHDAAIEYDMRRSVVPRFR